MQPTLVYDLVINSLWFLPVSWARKVKWVDAMTLECLCCLVAIIFVSLRPVHKGCWLFAAPWNIANEVVESLQA